MLFKIEYATYAFYLITVQVSPDKSNVGLLQLPPSIFNTVRVSRVRCVQCEEKGNGITGKEDLWRKASSLGRSKGIDNKNVTFPFSSSSHSGPRLCPR